MPRNTVYALGRTRTVGVIGWRFNAVHTDGRIVGIPTGDWESPPAVCTLRTHGHQPPEPSCQCGYHMVTDLRELTDYAATWLDSSYQWGMGQQPLPGRTAPAGRIILRAAALDPDAPYMQSTREDPPTTVRVRQLTYLGDGYLRRQDAHLAPLIGNRYPLAVTVLDTDDFVEIHTLIDDHEDAPEDATA